MTEAIGAFDGLRTIAVVGASRTTGKPAHDVPAYLELQGYDVLPVNPHASSIRGRPAVASLAAIGQHVDLVLVFRPPTEAAAIARAAADLGARTLWLQPGTASEEARGVAEEAGMRVVANVCIATAHALLGRGPGLDEGVACPVPPRRSS